MKDGRYYIGQTNALEERLRRHNAGRVPSTKCRAPLRVVYREVQVNRVQAMAREREIKSYKGGILFKRLVGTWKD